MDRLLDLLRDVSSAFQAQLTEASAAVEPRIAPFPARLLSVIGRFPGVSQQALAASTGRDKAQVARAMKELESQGLIGRAAHEADWRTQSLSLTTKGEKLWTDLEARRTQLSARVTADLTADEHAIAIQALDKIRRALGDPT